jgi:hypothetical protein
MTGSRLQHIAAQEAIAERLRGVAERARQATDIAPKRRTSRALNPITRRSPRLARLTTRRGAVSAP